ncbi:MAG: hypothetical protein M4579_000646 [Chaenotheca gracillima]|nr:MAG: hypothetical protein M4579_000646 [Chaenotheca gracillima]
MAGTPPPSQADADGGLRQDRAPPQFQQQNGSASSWKGREAGIEASRQSLRARQKKKKQSLLGALCTWIVENQIGISGNLILLLTLSHLLIPKSRPHTRKFFELAYLDTETGKYGIGSSDWSLVIYWIIIFTGLRAATMDYVLVPFARWGGVEKKKARIRFAEQGWLLIYYGVFWTMGMYIYYQSNAWMNLRELWVEWPTRQVAPLLKWYYLVQFAFWLQQIIVVNIEERRKDYHQMFTHHVITCALIFSSYAYLHTKIGNVILCLMDVVDIILALAKVLKYLHFDNACNVAFGVFMATWFTCRHVLYMMVVWSIYRDSPVMTPWGCYDTKSRTRKGDADPEELFGYLFGPLKDPSTICYNPKVMWTFLSLLLALQVITLIWFGMIARVAFRILNGQGAEDSRSDGEDEDEVEDKEVELELQLDGEALEDEEYQQEQQLSRKMRDSASPFEEEVGVEAINLKGRASPVRRFRRSAGTASGVTLPGSDRKELLGRIGCDKTT